MVFVQSRTLLYLLKVVPNSRTKKTFYTNCIPMSMHKVAQSTLVLVVLWFIMCHGRIPDRLQ